MLAICITGAHQILLHTSVHKKALHFVQESSPWCHGQIIIMQSIVAKVIMLSTQRRRESWIRNFYAIERAHP